jgi:hypothetical protein
VGDIYISYGIFDYLKQCSFFISTASFSPEGISYGTGVLEDVFL